MKMLRNSVGVCPGSEEKREFDCHQSNEKSLSSMIHKFVQNCTTCPWTGKFYSSKKSSCTTSLVNKYYDINFGSIIAMGEIGRSCNALEIFSQYAVTSQ